MQSKMRILLDNYAKKMEKYHLEFLFLNKEKTALRSGWNGLAFPRFAFIYKVRQRWAFSVFFNFFNNKKILFFAYFIKLI